MKLEMLKEIINNALNVGIDEKELEKITNLSEITFNYDNPISFTITARNKASFGSIAQTPLINITKENNF